MLDCPQGLLTDEFLITGVVSSGSSWGNFTPSRSNTSKVSGSSIFALFGGCPTILITFRAYAFLELQDVLATVGPPDIRVTVGPRD